MAAVVGIAIIVSLIVLFVYCHRIKNKGNFLFQLKHIIKLIVHCIYIYIYIYIYFFYYYMYAICNQSHVIPNCFSYNV